jgi:(1->4)-alpha-D-glucan 1-alpha-D-glucosylmutase
MAPRATYRLQLTSDVTFDTAVGLIDYLDALGVSHLYASPIEQARPGSTHGYDVVDHRHLSAELGGADAFGRLATALRATGMRLLVDIVPNHMAVSVPHNRAWTDVLRLGRRSELAEHFDIDWDPPEHRLANRILLPVLPDHYGRVLEAHELRLERHGGEIWLRYADLLFPIDPDTIDADASDDTLAAINADADALDALIIEQHYRLAYWRVGQYETDYRRFFDVDSLIGVRIERPEVFEETHALLLSLLAPGPDGLDGVVDGIRIDHLDGLREPLAYLQRLRRRAPRAWLLVEKILEPDEQRRTEWPIDGTTGYEFARITGGLFVDPASASAITSMLRDMTGIEATFDDVAHEAKLDVLHQSLAPDIDRLASSFLEVCERHRRFRDFAREELRETLRETLACFPVYRTYGTAVGVVDADLAVIEIATNAAVKHRPDLDPELFELLHHILAGDAAFNGPHEVELRLRFQQVAAVVMAKGKEDTALYRYPRLLAMNEVGGDPSTFGIDPDAFHGMNERAQRQWPRTMLGLSTHDSKRSEDVRARLAALSEVPEVWAATMQRWRAHNGQHRVDDAPDATLEHLLYQTLIGAYPLSLERAWQHVEKAMREAKQSTSWTAPDERFEDGVRHFVTGLYDDPWFQHELRELVGRVLFAGRVTSLAQKLLLLTSPGVPDLYQGTELWDLSLVDPDNRRPIDFTRRRALLERLRATPEAELPAFDLADEHDPGLAKLMVIERALALRRLHPEWFDERSSYTAVPATGPQAAHVVAFSRAGHVIVAVPRLVIRATGIDHPSAARITAALPLPPGRWRDVLSAGSVHRGEASATDLFDHLPVALLVRDERSTP